MRFSLHQFAAVFKVLDPAGKPYVLIGGQAVNYWAETFLPTEPTLAGWMPFTSEDIDFRGGRDDAVRIARQLGLTVRFPHEFEMTALAGVIPFKIDDLPTNIEVVRAVPGVSANHIDAWAISAQRDSRHIRVVDPISLLACKCKLALTVSQDDRRDVDHLRIMVICVRAFLRETLRGVEAGALPVKGWLGAAERTLALAESADGRKAARQFAIHWPDILPLAEIKSSASTRLRPFREKRLAPWLAKLTRPHH
ncbi:MAG: hypothetical protein AB1705_26055 [Verrucomicrobiota bacterium]